MAAEDLKQKIYDVLKEVYDPEIPVNIVDLGLVYDVWVDNGKALVKMTLTSPACPVAPQVVENARSKILSIEGIQEAEIELVWEPMWNPDMMSLEARDKLGML